MRHASIAVLGDESAAARLGKRGTPSDVTMYAGGGPGEIVTWIAPSGHPDRIQPLMQAIAMAEHAAVAVGSLGRELGEQIVALEAAGMASGAIECAPGVDAARLEAAVAGTVLEGYARAGPGGLAAAALGLGPPEMPAAGPVRVDVDHCFDVRGAGTVALGRVVSGTVRRDMEVYVAPSGAAATVRSIQVSDAPAREAGPPARVGLALRGVRPADVRRGDALCSPAAEARAEVGVGLSPCPHYAGEVAAGRTYVASIGLQARAARVASAGPVRLELDRPALCPRGARVVLLDPGASGLRIAGWGPAD